MKEFRCSKCNKLLGKKLIGTIEIKCPRCGEINKKHFDLPDVEFEEIDPVKMAEGIREMIRNISKE